MVLAGVYFIVFFVSFYLNEFIRFQYFFIRQPPAPFAVPLMATIAVVAGIFAFLGFKKLGLYRGKIIYGVGLGSLFGLSFNVGVFVIEDFLNESKLIHHVELATFADYSGHCGLEIGQGIAVRSLSKYEIWKMDERCRLIHWKEYESRAHFCNGKFECEVDVASHFAEKGNWGLLERRFFFDLVSTSREAALSPEQVEQYFTFDQSLLKKKLPWFERAGITEALNDRFELMNREEELGHLMLTKEIVSWVRNEAKPEAGSELFLRLLEIDLNQLEKEGLMKEEIETIKRRIKN